MTKDVDLKSDVQIWNDVPKWLLQSVFLIEEKIMKITIVNLIFWVSIFALCCYPSRQSRDSFTFSKYCYTATKNQEITKIYSKGYYSFHDSTYGMSGYPPRLTLSNSYYNYVFYTDGQFIMNFEPILHYGFRGSYFINEDTIKAQFAESQHSMSSNKGAIWCKIINKNTLQRIGFTWDEPMSDADLKRYQSKNPKEFHTCGNFVQYDSLPDPNKSWLKKRKWFWCNEEEYRIWRKGK